MKEQVTALADLPAAFVTQITEALVYQRVSSDEQDTARQHAENLAECAAHGWHVTEFSDDGIGASSRSRGKLAGANRPDYQALTAAVLTAREGTRLVVHDVSRADRQLETWSALLASCRRHGVLVHVTSDHETYDPRKANHWRLLATAGVNAESESLVKGDQIRSGIAYWRAQGHPHGRLIYGIARKRDPDKIRNRWLADVPDPQTAPVARRIVLAVAARVPYRQIARGLDQDGVPTPRGGASWRMAVTSVASHAAEYADLGIVTSDQASNCLAVLASTAGMGRGSGTKAQVHRYSNCIACHVCGAALRGTRRRGQSARYACAAGHVSIGAADMDAYIDAWCIARLSQPDAAGLATASTSTTAANARAQAAVLQDELDQWVTSGISARAYALKEAELMPKIRAALATAQQASLPALAGLPDSDAGIVADRWHSLTTGARKDALRALAPGAVLGAGKRDGSVPVERRLTMH